MDLIKQSVLTPELLAELKRLQFQARHLANQGVAGKYRSAFKGQGIEFEEVREYVPGDDIRSIDWKVTARSRKPFVKSFREERELTVMLAVDVSTSTRTGTRQQLRSALIARLGAVLALIALKNNDKVGLITFSDRIETYHPPRKARSSIWRILHEVMAPAAYSPRTNIGESLGFLNKVMKRAAIVFVISDFLDTGFEEQLAVLGKRHDVTAVLVADPCDDQFPQAGLVLVRDPESGKEVLIDSASSEFRSNYARLCREQREELRRMLRRRRVGLLEVSANRPFLNDLRRFFDSRRQHSYFSQFAVPERS